MIHYLTPYSTDKNIGKAYNEAIGALVTAPNDWVVVMDGDISFLTPEWGRQIAEVASNTDFALIGCITGRLRSKYQLYNGKFDSKCDMYKCFDIARELESTHWAEVEEVPGIAGMLSLIHI